MDTWLTKAEACRHLKVSPPTLERLMEDGRIPPPVYLTPRTPRWDREAIDKALRHAGTGASSGDVDNAVQDTIRDIAARRSARRQKAG